ncbi:calpain-2 catalytic subunit-like [Denticeps clupeoides]|uniref:calpain-2 catalytic subunit-like n=1 Tax=Denticeps clupeoides TaxID=299321 RepID=UPI0010A2DDEF|nr:calpain-2 catalytic subunit-like [Denticeps clupeoides]
MQNKRAAPFLAQDFQAIRRECLKSGKLFTDDAFPALQSSLGFNLLGPGSYKVLGVEWKRPGEFCSNPQFVSDGTSKADICQGELGDCWLLAAIASLTLQKDILARVVPQDQSFQKDYAGIFHFQFWQYGEWVDVVVDDRLPVRKGKLIFVQSSERSEFWSALMEKAYAKLNGSYEALKGGLPSESFTDLTGGIVEVYDLSKPPPYLFMLMRKAMALGSLLATFTKEVAFQNLDKLHAYSITGMEEVHGKSGTVQLVRLRNPWGCNEWKGAWSDESKEWDLIDPKEKAKLNYSADDGEFWMSYPDFKSNLWEVHICNLTPDALTGAQEQLHTWSYTQFDGAWKPGSTAGGCNSFKTSFHTNPQFGIKLDEVDDDPYDGEVGCSFLVGLIQKEIRKEKKFGRKLNNIGFAIYEVPQECKGRADVSLGRDALLKLKPVAVTQPFLARRELCQRLKLPAGEYIIIPSTETPYLEGSFTLRLFFEKLPPTRNSH